MNSVLQPEEILKLKNKLYDDYILDKINIIKKDKIKNLENINNLSKEEYDQILLLIDEDFINEKNNIIKKNVEETYNQNILNKLLNKADYLNKNIKYYTNVVHIIEDTIKKQNNIENNYVSYYCDNLIREYLYCSSNKKKTLTLKNIFIEIIALENKYSNIHKRLALLAGFSDDIKKIVEYEKVKYQLSLKQNKNQNESMNSLSKNVKILRLNTNKIINNGFFGL